MLAIFKDRTSLWATLRAERHGEKTNNVIEPRVSDLSKWVSVAGQKQVNSRLSNSGGRRESDVKWASYIIFRVIRLLTATLD